MVTDDQASVAEAVSPAFGLSPEQGLETPHALVGSVDQIVDLCLERRERYGISMIGFSLDAMTMMAPVVARLAGT
jgi:hypothetical protein